MDLVCVAVAFCRFVVVTSKSGDGAKNLGKEEVRDVSDERRVRSVGSTVDEWPWAWEVERIPTCRDMASVTRLPERLIMMLDDA